MYVNAGDYIEMGLSCGGTGNIRVFAGSMSSVGVRFRREQS